MGSYARLFGFVALTGCLGPIPQAAEDDPAGGGGSTAANDGGNPSNGGAGASDGGNGTGAGTSDGGSVPMEPTLGGELHFLQGGSVTLANGGETKVVATNGPFTFDELLGENDAYDVTVTSSPPGQTCWVQNGSGTAEGAVTDIDVRCSTVLRSQTPGGASDGSTNQPSFQPIPDLPPITFRTDIASDVMATLLIPKLSWGSFRIALELDGDIVGEANHQSADFVPVLTMPIVDVPAGEHTLTAVWAVTSGSIIQYASVYRSEMSVSVLQSLPSFDRKLTTTLAWDGGDTGLGNNETTPSPMGFTPLTFDVPGAAQPTLVSLLANDMKGDRFAARFSVDDTGVAGSLMSYDINAQLVRSFAPVALTNLATGSHTIDAQWFKNDPGNVPATRGTTNNLDSTLSAVLFKPGTESAIDTLEGSYLMNPVPAGFTLVTSSLQTTIDVPKASNVLVTLHAPNMRITPSWPASADVAIFVNGARGPTTHPYNANDIDWGCQGLSVAGVVNVPAGTTTIEVRARRAADANVNQAPAPNNDKLQFNNMGLNGANRTILSAIVLD